MSIGNILVGALIILFLAYLGYEAYKAKKEADKPITLYDLFHNNDKK